MADDEQQQEEKRVLSIQQLLALHQHAPVAAANQPRRRAHKDFIIDLDGSQLQVYPTGVETGQKQVVDQDFVHAHIVQPGSSSFQPHAREAALAVVKAHPGWPHATNLKWPNSQSNKKAKSASGGASRSGAAAAAAEAATAAPDGAGDGGGAGTGAGAAVPAAAGQTSQRDGQEEVASSTWPEPGRRKAWAQPPSKTGASRMGNCVHADAVWYMCAACNWAVNGCPTKVVVMQEWGPDGKLAQQLHVKFSSECVHDGEPPAEQTRGAERANLVAQSHGRTGTMLHKALLQARTPAQVLDGATHMAGASAQVVRQAQYEARKQQTQSDPDPVIPLERRMLHKAKEDVEQTPQVDRKLRLWGSDIASYHRLPDGSFVVLRMTDLHLWAWILLCKDGGGGWYVDMTEGVVRLIDGEKVFLTQLLCIDSGGCTFKIGEILHSTRACYSCDLALQTVKHSLERLCTSGTMATIAPGRLWPAFFYTDKDMALLNSLCCFANRRNEHVGIP